MISTKYCALVNGDKYIFENALHRDLVVGQFANKVYWIEIHIQ